MQVHITVFGKQSVLSVQTVVNMLSRADDATALWLLNTIPVVERAAVYKALGS